MESMKTMNSNDLSAREFFQLTVNSLLELCTHCIDGHRIVSIEGRLLLTLDTGDKVELNILQQDVGSLLKSVKVEDADTPCSAVISPMDGGLPLSAETGLAVEDSVALESLDNVHETELTGSCTDEGDQSFADADSMPSAVLQANGEFMCSSCGEVMKCARAIKRHISTHMSLLSLAHSASPCDETADRTVGVINDPVTPMWPVKQVRAYTRLPMSDSSKDSGKPWRSYACKDCSNVFTSSGLRALHSVQTHRPHKCLKCGIVIAGRRNFSQHVRKEHPGAHICKAQKLFVCEYCSRTFHYEPMLKDHISTVHLGTIEHRCDQCGKVLGSAVTLRIHQRQLHERANERTCDGCGLQFTRLAGLIHHLTCTHPHLLPDKYRHLLDDLVCKECGLTFSRRTSLQRHLEVRHGGAPKHICLVCSRRFRCRRYVLRHIRSYHPEINDSSRPAMVENIGDDDCLSTVSDASSQL